MFQFPFQFYGRQVDQIKVSGDSTNCNNLMLFQIYSNGFIALGNHSLQVPPNYPSQTAYSKHRLNELEGDFIGVFTTVNQCSQNGNIIIRAKLTELGQIHALGYYFQSCLSDYYGSHSDLSMKVTANCFHKKPLPTFSLELTANFSPRYFTKLCEMALAGFQLAHLF
ncbi:hypothetical protein EGR_05315 [Echinococcus granulosus]|uniref:Uncharacterized protein n=1 Tax=Echinococcus granulosus TaxID=6210 RepID=W6V1S9_ECHGR|nr:hypothetical protein EGR_05315 [Echinococcus granulosus]EUB59839.1 hypothetical protein EGR_05315 [Echinococcus granulosus]